MTISGGKQEARKRGINLRDRLPVPWFPAQNRNRQRRGPRDLTTPPASQACPIAATGPPVEPDIVVCAETSDGRRAIRLVLTHRPDVILMDIAMAVLNGVEATRQILIENPKAKVIMLSAHSDQGYILRAIKAGAVGYLLKHASAEVLAHAIREVHRGHAYFSPAIARHIATSCHAPPPPLPTTTARTFLTTRESEVIQLIAEGFSTKQIAHELCLGEKTIEKHRQRLMDKLDIHNIAGLTRYAVRQGVIERGSASVAEMASA